MKSNKKSKSIFRKLLCVGLSALVAAFLVACGSAYGDANNSSDGGWFDLIDINQGGDSFTEIGEQDFFDITESKKTSNILLSVSTASYSNIRRRILDNQNVPADAVKIEEMINYFGYSYPEPEVNKPLSMSASVIKTPWNENTSLLSVGMKAENISRVDRVNNIVFLIDVSGSMYGADRLDLVIKGFTALADELKANDRISIVTYASSQKVVLDGAYGSETERIAAALNSLKASGSTAGGSAIQRAYETAEKYRAETDNSTIILATDGDFNVGATSPEALKALVSEYAGKGINMSVIGVGMGNYKSTTMETLADAGGGRAGYISDLESAKKFMADELGAMINIVAEDAMAQIEFNPARVDKVRIIGYENRQISDEEWSDPETKAGYIGSGTTVTAVYEIILKENSNALDPVASLNLKYRDPKAEKDENGQKPQLTDSLEISEKHLYPEASDPTVITRDDREFIACVVETGLLLRNSEFKGTATYKNVITRLLTIEGIENSEYDQYKTEFLSLVRLLDNR